MGTSPLSPSSLESSQTYIVHITYSIFVGDDEIYTEKL